jgi:hypothetical protein
MAKGARSTTLKSGMCLAIERKAKCSPSLSNFAHCCCRYEAGWPAIWRDCLGLVIVYNPDRTEEEDLVDWHTWFAKPAGLKDSQARDSLWMLRNQRVMVFVQVLILAHSPDRPPEKKPLRSPQLSLTFSIGIFLTLIFCHLQPKPSLKFNAPLPRWDHPILKSLTVTRRPLLPLLNLF